MRDYWYVTRTRYPDAVFRPLVVLPFFVALTCAVIVLTHPFVGFPLPIAAIAFGNVASITISTVAAWDMRRAGIQTRDKEPV